MSQTMGVRAWTKQGITTRLWNGLRKVRMIRQICWIFYSDGLL